MMKVVMALKQKKWGDDDIENDLEALHDSLEKNMAILKYAFLSGGAL